MKVFSGLLCTALVVSSVLTSCGTLPTQESESSSNGKYADKSWLEAKIGSVPENVTIGLCADLGVDMTDFEDDGYIIRTENGETVICGKTESGLDLAVRKYAKTKKNNADVEDTVYHEGYRIENLTVAGRNIADYTVVYTHTENPTMPTSGITRGNGEYAAKEFVRLIKEATGIELPMSDTAVSSPFISFEAVKDTDTYGETGFSYEIKDGNLYFRGSSLAAGCSNGVYYFCEHELGWHNLTYGDATLMEAEHIDIPAGLYHKGELCFDSLELACFTKYGEYFHGNNPTSEYRGILQKACHGLQNIVFEYERDMENYAVYQICYSDEETYNELYQIEYNYLDNCKKAGMIIGEDVTYIDIAQRDTNWFCDCKACKAILKEEKSQSGAIVRMANRLSEDLDKDFHGLKYLIFAYTDTKKPPEVTKTNEMVSVTFCLDGCCCKHAINSGECQNKISFGSFSLNNDDYTVYLDKWSAMCPNVYIWYYKLDGCFAQFSLIDIMYYDITYFREHGIKGLFLNGDCYGVGTGRFEHDMLSALQWNPDMTKEEYDALLYQKLTDFYGYDGIEAFNAVKKLTDFSVLSKQCRTGWIGSKIDTLLTDYKAFAEGTEEALAIVEEQIENAPSRDAELRGERLSLVLLYEGSVYRYVKAVKDGDTEMISHLEELYAEFVERSIRAGYDMANYTMGIGGQYAVGTTLEEEGEYWLGYENELLN